VVKDHREAVLSLRNFLPRKKLSSDLFSEICSKNDFPTGFIEGMKAEDLTSKSVFGQTLLHLALLRDDFDLIKLLVAKGADLRVKDNKGWNSVHYAARFCNSEIMQFVLDTNKDGLEEKDNKGNTPLFCAVHRADLEMVKLLVFNGADPKARDKDGGTPFHDAACDDKRLPILEFFLDNGLAEVDDQRTEDGKSALHLAAERGCVENIMFLISRGANLKLKSKEYKTAEQISKKSVSNFFKVYKKQ